jgi:hypothetical protein
MEISTANCDPWKIALADTGIDVRAKILLLSASSPAIDSNVAGLSAAPYAAS